MDTLTARPGLLKQANLSRIRRAIKARCTATRGEITEDTKISSTTVRSLLSEMLENGEIESMGHDESSGGRKAERYRLQPERYHGAAFCITDNQLYSLLVNVCGEIVETTRLEVQNDDFQRAIIDYLDVLVQKRELKSIGIGVPGAVEGGSYWIKSGMDGELYKMDIGDVLAQRYHLPVILENDLNATAIGFKRCYEKEFSRGDPDDTNMIYLHFAAGCISAGIIAGGRIIRGFNNFAGELGLIPVEDYVLLDECLSKPMDDKKFAGLAIKIIGWLCGILNPQYIVLGGPALRKNCIAYINEGLSSRLPRQILTEIVYAPDVWHDYYDGMAYLTAGKMFDEIQFIKE